MKKNKKYFYLFATCIPVAGARRSIIIDTQRNKIFFIPNALYQIIRLLKTMETDLVKQHVDHQDTLESYLDFLVENELGIYTDSLKKFPPLQSTYRFPGEITNVIIEVSNDYRFPMDDIVSQLSDLGCESMELRFLNWVPKEYLFQLLNSTKGSTLRSIIVNIPHNEELDEEAIRLICKNYPRICNIHLYRCIPLRPAIKVDKCSVTFTQQESINCKMCGNISVKYFHPNFQMYSESLVFNSCLNKKISICADGEIKNCPSQSTSYGKIEVVRLKDVVETNRFSMSGRIRKEDIQGCRDCEFRCICLDCRSFLSDPNDIYSKPLKCGYDPYTNEWNDWRKDPSKENAIKYYGL